MSFFDYIKVPFAYLLEWLTTFLGNYGLALFAFALIVKVILLPMSAKSKKSMMKMSRVTPKVKALEAQFGDDKQKYNEAVQKLYKEEGVSTCGGCIWSLIPLLLLIPLYAVIRQPVTWLLLHGGEQANAAVEQLKGFFNVTTNNAYWEMDILTKIPENLSAIKTALPDVGALLENSSLSICSSMSILGIDLSTIPQWKLWNVSPLDWNAIGQFLIPLVSGGFNWLSMFIGQKMNNQVITDDKGEKDADMAKKAGASNKLMNIMMPLMSVVFGFIMPAGLSIYWIAQAIFGMIQDYFLTKHYKRIYDAEDALKQQKAAEEAAEEARREAIRAEKRAANPDGITENTSKKKLEQQKKAEKAAAEAAYQAKLAAGSDVEETPEATGEGPRRFSRGRAYRADRYEEENKE